MKRNATIAVMLALSVPMLGFAQGNNAQTMNMKGMPQSSQSGMGGKSMDGRSCQDMMKGMDMKNMDARSCQDMMKGTDGAQAGKDAKGASYQATGVVKAVDPAKGRVTIAHGPVEGLQWPAMTMNFAVNDKTLFNKLAVDKTVDVDFVQQGGQYVITTVK